MNYCFAIGGFSVDRRLQPNGSSLAGSVQTKLGVVWRCCSGPAYGGLAHEHTSDDRRRKRGTGPPGPTGVVTHILVWIMGVIPKWFSEEFAKVDAEHTVPKISLTP